MEGLLLIGGILVVFGWVLKAVCGLFFGIGKGILGDGSCSSRRDGRN